MLSPLQSKNILKFKFIFYLSLKECTEYGKCLESSGETFGSLNLSIRSIISKLKQKYEVDTTKEEDSEMSKYIRLLYLKELNADFIELQKEYELFKQMFFN